VIGEYDRRSCGSIDHQHYPESPSGDNHMSARSRT